MKCARCRHDIPAGKNECLYCGAAVGGRAKNDENTLPGDAGGRGAEIKRSEDYLMTRLSVMKSERKSPVSKTVLACVFFVSMLVGGVIVWLLK